MRTSSILFGIALLLTSTASHSTKLYKWTDEKGRINYGSQKPTQYKSVEVNRPPPPPADSPDLNKEAREQILQNSKSKASASSGSSGKSNTKAQCDAAKANLEALQNNARVRYTDNDGETAVMDDKMKQEKIKESKEQVKTFCK